MLNLDTIKACQDIVIPTEILKKNPDIFKLFVCALYCLVQKKDFHC